MRALPPTARVPMPPRATDPVSAGDMRSTASGTGRNSSGYGGARGGERCRTARAAAVHLGPVERQRHLPEYPRGLAKDTQRGAEQLVHEGYDGEGL